MNNSELAYIELLEKTNQQLSLWSNPYSFLVSVLSFLVAFLAIASAFILYRQSQEYKSSFKKALDDYQTLLSEKIVEVGLRAERKIDSFIAEKRTEIESLTGDTKKQTKKIIEDLEKERESISSRVQFGSLTEEYPVLEVMCKRCGNVTSALHDSCMFCASSLEYVDIVAK